MAGAYYLNQLHCFLYYLPCGHVFKSHIRSSADDNGLHWFYCRACEEHIAQTTAALKEEVPWDTNSRLARMGEGLYYRRIDDAILKDRIRMRLKYYRDIDLSAPLLGRLLGVSPKLVRKVTDDLGLTTGQGRRVDLGIEQEETMQSLNKRLRAGCPTLYDLRENERYCLHDTKKIIDKLEHNPKDADQLAKLPVARERLFAARRQVRTHKEACPKCAGGKGRQPR